MKFATAKEHRDFFQKQGWIEFDHFLSSEQLSQANQAIDRVLKQRLNVPHDQLHYASPETIFLQGHDLWRSDPELGKLAILPRFAEIAAELFEKKPLRLGYDQLLLPPLQNQQPGLYAPFLEKSLNLEEASCLTCVVGGLILALGEEHRGESDPCVSEGMDIFPSQGGNVSFFHAKVPVHWKNIYAHAGQRYYLIVYVQQFSHYQLQPQDPHTHALKRLGYVYNDKLNDKLHPIVYR